MTLDDDLAVERAHRLMDAVPAIPMPWELATLRRAAALARTRIVLPSQLLVRWRHLPDDSAPGACDGSGPEPVVYLAVAPSIRRDDLAAVALHELQHAADYHAAREFERADYEERADTFSREMMTFWRAGVRPATSTSTSTTRAPSTIPRPQSLRPSAPCPRAMAVRGVVEEIHHRVRRLLARLPGEDARALRVVAGLIDELEQHARKGDA